MASFCKYWNEPSGYIKQQGILGPAEELQNPLWEWCADIYAHTEIKKYICLLA
jgi:hypothetical protein